MGENKMETLGEDNTQVECKQTDVNEGGILRRLRDRDLLKKRRVEAEEKAIYQVQSKRKRERSEGKSGPGRKGRPKKSDTSFPPQPPQEEAPLDGRTEEEQPQRGSPSQPEEQFAQDPSKEEEPALSDAAKPREPLTANISDVMGVLPAVTFEGEVGSLPPPGLPATLSQTLTPLLPPPAAPAPPAPEPQAEMVPVPAQEQAPQPEVKDSQPKEEVTIEDLGPEDEEAEPSLSVKLVMEQGRTEEPGENVTDNTQVFSIPTIVSPPQPSYLPGPSL